MCNNVYMHVSFIGNSMEAQNKSKITVFKALISFIASVIIYLAFYVLSVLVTIIDWIVQRLISPSKGFVKRGRVLLRCKISILHPVSSNDFLCLFTSRVVPDYVLKPRVSLYCVTHKEAVFIETERNCNIYNSDENPFLYVAQFCRARYVIKMPLETFHTLADKIGDPSLPVILVSSTGRCGSTMLCQVFESVPGTLVMSEPDAISNISLQTNAELESQRELTSTIRVLCKPHPGIERYVIKTRSTSTALMMDITKLFPTFRQIFMYRNCLETVLSFMAMFTSVPYTILLRTCIDSETISAITPFFRTKLRDMLLPNVKNAENVAVDTNFTGLFIHVWSNYIRLARDAISENPDILPVKYEDLKANPVDMCRTIVKTLDIDPDSINESLPVFTRDSQRGSVFSCNKVKTKRQKNISDTDSVAADAILSRYGLPPLGTEFRL